MTGRGPTGAGQAWGAPPGPSEGHGGPVCTPAGPVPGGPTLPVELTARTSVSPWLDRLSIRATPGPLLSARNRAVFWGRAGVSAGVSQGRPFRRATRSRTRPSRS